MSDIITEATDYCRRAGIRLSTLGVRALENSRFFDRLPKKIEQIETDAERLRAYMAANPPQDGAQ